MSGLLAGKVWQSDLDAHLKPLAAALADIANDDGTSIYPSVEYMAWLLSKGERSVQMGLAELKEKGVLEPVAYEKGGRGQPTEYKLHEEKLPKRTTWREHKKGATDAPFTEERVQSTTERVQSTTERVQPVAPNPLVEPLVEPLVGSRHKRSPDIKKMSDEEFQTFLKSNPAYSHLDLVREAGKMRAYCATHSKQPTRKYFVAWLNRIDPPLIAQNGNSPPRETKEEKQSRLEKQFHRKAS